MKKIILLVFILSIFGACVSSRKHLDRGEYDMAINKAIKKIQGNRSNEKEIFVLEEAYKKANNKNKERIDFLKLEGTPENWKSIFELYTQIEHRQNMIKTVVPLYITSIGRNASLEIYNYDQDIILAKQKAAEYFYTHALSLLDKNNKELARKAYTELHEVKSYYNNFRDVDSYLQKARSLGMSYVLFKVQNKSGIPLPPNFEEELSKINLHEMDTEWLDFQVSENKKINYDYSILVNIKAINIGPEEVKELHYIESKDVPDGEKYLLDENGNVKKDSKGIEIKQKKYKTVRCVVVENYQFKKASIIGSLDYLDNRNSQLIKTDPITSETLFEHRSALAVGDYDALKGDTRAKVGKTPIPFPSSFDMILQAGQTLKGMVKNIIVRNKNVLY